MPMEGPNFADEFDYKLEFSCFKKLLVSVINKDVIMNTGGHMLCTSSIMCTSVLGGIGAIRLYTECPD
jgi:hypothetical protein